MQLKIWIIGDNDTTRFLWGNLFANYFSNYQVEICHQKDFLIQKEEFGFEDIVVCLLGEVDHTYQKIIERLMGYCVPMICVMDNSTKDSFEILIRKGVKGILNAQDASLDTITDAMRIVQKGGVYIESFFMNKHIFPCISLASDEKPTLNMTEWSVFSLTSKGFTVAEIAELLNQPSDIISDYQNRILEKTQNKTMSGAVASGINQGWFKDMDKLNK